jgi:hypothetical protein
MIVTKGMYDKEFKFMNNGKEETILIKPLPTSYLKKLFTIVKKFNEGNTSSEDMVAILSESEVLPILIEVVAETVRKSYPDLDSVSLDEFVGINMFTLIPFIIEVNFKK